MPGALFSNIDGVTWVPLAMPVNPPNFCMPGIGFSPMFGVTVVPLRSLNRPCAPDCAGAVFAVISTRPSGSVVIV